MSYGTHHALKSGVRFSHSPSSAKGMTMKMLNVFAPKSAFLAARERFYRVRQICTRSLLTYSPRSVTWTIRADLDGTGELPRTIVAGGVCETRAQAREAMRQRFELWTLNGPTAMRVLGRASW
jgi:hypothetical protein